MNNKIKFRIIPTGRTESNTAIHIWFLLKGNQDIINIQESTENILEYHCDSDNIFCVLYNMIR